MLVFDELRNNKPDTKTLLGFDPTEVNAFEHYTRIQNNEVEDVDDKEVQIPTVSTLFTINSITRRLLKCALYSMFYADALTLPLNDVTYSQILSLVAIYHPYKIHFISTNSNDINNSVDLAIAVVLTLSSFGELYDFYFSILQFKNFLTIIFSLLLRLSFLPPLSSSSSIPLLSTLSLPLVVVAAAAAAAAAVIRRVPSSSRINKT
jgi:hypothetical protein